EVRVRTDLWHAVLSNQGAVISEWMMTKFTDGQLIDAAKGGVNLVSSKITREVGGFFRFYIPSDKTLEQQLNLARFVIEGSPEQEVFVNAGERKEISFTYNDNTVFARKRLVFKGVGADRSSGFDFDFQAEVTRNGQPVEAYVVVGPNFGDQSVVEVTTYKHAPQISYAVGTSVRREYGESVAKEGGQKQLGAVSWAAVDDNYFAMALVPAQPIPAVGLSVHRKDNVNGKELERDLVSVALRINPGQVNHVYAGPKALDTLGLVSANFGLGNQSASLEDIVSYGILDFISGMLKPIARFMLWALRQINQFTHNWGWSIVVLTVLLNMFFFPLRWRSSVMMKKAAAMQPRMKELQDEMRKLDKNDPRVMELQRQQLALMKEGNPLMGCLPLLLQMPFFMAVFAILTVSIEVRHAPFFGWLNDLSAPDPYWLLPIIMCVTMIAQTALTPTTADPVQKKVSYIMPPVLTYFFFISAPAGLVLYWMVGNLVGVGQQFVINKMTGPSTPAAPAVDAPEKKSSGTGKKKAKEALAN
ncbi:MAG TPA: membrane protein insertase YidC, partial [Blastocatellia bacterium]|nr:membrane protein insertase YidC [Blastocatellia bacterium]